MGLNCKQGDLAIVVKSYAGNEGRIVRCVKFIGDQRHRFPGGAIRNIQNCWEVDQQLNTINVGIKSNIVGDERLRPIRDSDKQDEMLSIVILKEKVKA
jgi:hypothetical protein